MEKKGGKQERERERGRKGERARGRERERKGRNQPGKSIIEAIMYQSFKTDRGRQGGEGKSEGRRDKERKREIPSDLSLSSGKVLIAPA